MLKTRIIPCLDVADGRVVKGVNFVGLRDAGDPVESAKAYDAAGADEICFLDIHATHENRGTMFDVVQRTAERLGASHPQLVIAGYHHGYFWDDEEAVVEQISRSGASMLFVAISPPKKEIFINRWKERMGIPFAMGVGGTFDIVAGKSKRAPQWMQSSGLEWLYRVIQEPRRMWKRYLVTNGKFAWMMTKALAARVLRR